MARILYGGSRLDRADSLRRDETRLAALLAGPTARVVPYWRGAARIEAGRLAWATGQPGRHIVESSRQVAFLGLEGDIAWFGADLSHVEADESGPELPIAGAFAPLRAIAALLPPEEAALLAYLRALMHWHARQRHCGACGAPTRSVLGGQARHCTEGDCRLEHFPRVDPAIIVLVSDGARCLLGRQARWPAGMYSCLAGFVEPGETLEETVAREVREETGVLVDDIRYVASQPWPFPSSLMIGFAARATSTALRVDHAELEDAGWFGRDELLAFPETGRMLPRADSIARHLMDLWLYATRENET